ncbi:MAG: thioredoxin domain-containing protein [Aggregatilineales bacterium]
MTSNDMARREKAGLLVLVVGGVLIVAILVVVALMQGNAPITPSAPPVVAQGQFAETGMPLLGDPKAPLLLIEFSNFSCPGCAQYHPTIKQIIERHVNTGSAALIFAPMIFSDGEHPSYIAAQAALCADKQGKFWQMNSALFEIHLQRGARSFTLPVVQQAGRELGLDVEALTTCIAAEETRSIIINSMTLAEQVGLQYTPTLLYSRDGGKTWSWFTQPDGSRYEAGVPLAAVDQLIAAR